MTPDAPLFSIITPVYRTPLGYLEACIASVEAQTFRDWELLLVDNGNEGTGELVIQRAASDRRLRVIRSAENFGISEGSQLGVAAANGEFIALLDHDDTLSPVALSRMADGNCIRSDSRLHVFRRGQNWSCRTSYFSPPLL